MSGPQQSLLMAGAIALGPARSFLMNAESPDTTNPTDKSVFARTSGGFFSSPLLCSATQAKYGTFSIFGDSSPRSLWYADDADLRFGSGDFTIQSWVYPLSSSIAALIGKRNSTGNANDSWVLFNNFTGNVVAMLELNSGGVAATRSLGAGLTNNTWSHIAFTRSSGTLRGFINGTKLLEVASSHVYGGTEILIVGGNTSTNSPFDGFFDDLALTKGVAEYTANFTPPIGQLGQYV